MRSGVRGREGGSVGVCVCVCGGGVHAAHTEGDLISLQISSNVSLPSSIKEHLSKTDHHSNTKSCKNVFSYFSLLNT